MDKQEIIDQLQGLGYEVADNISNTDLKALLTDIDNCGSVRVYWGCFKWLQ